MLLIFIGINNFLYSILEIVNDAKILIEREQYFIDTLNPEYNSNLIARTGFHGKHTEEAKRRMSIFHTGKKHSIETRIKLSNLNKNKKKTPEHIQKVMISRKETGYGEKSIVQYDNLGNFITFWNSIKECGIALNIFPSEISGVLRGKTPTAKGFIFRYNTDNNTENIIIGEKYSYNRKAVLQFTKDGTFISEYNSILEASKVVNISPASIQKCCDKIKNYNTAAGFVWKFKKDN